MQIAQFIVEIWLAEVEMHILMDFTRPPTNVQTAISACDYTPNLGGEARFGKDISLSG
jgi:hypothetical protein